MPTAYLVRDLTLPGPAYLAHSLDPTHQAGQCRPRPASSTPVFSAACLANSLRPCLHDRSCPWTAYLAHDLIPPGCSRSQPALPKAHVAHSHPTHPAGQRHPRPASSMAGLVHNRPPTVRVHANPWLLTPIVFLVRVLTLSGHSCLWPEYH